MGKIGYSISILYYQEAPKHYAPAVEYYEKRLGQMIHFQSSKVVKLPPVDYLYILDANGKEYDTPGFTDFVKKEGAAGKRLCFAVGPAQGFPDDVKSSFKSISLSPLTFQHDLARLVLLEQIYRAILTIHGIDYNK